jgi:acetyl-CoA synthetase
VHTTGGYLLGAALTVKYVFDVHPDDKFACMADVGWITGHTYIVYGPLLNGVSTVVFESTPVYPTPSRYWQVVEKHRLTQFYTAPTAIRLLRRLGAHHTEPHDLSSLRVLGSVGEPINPEAWNWFNEHVGKFQAAIVDTFWQTETGSIVVTPFPGAIETKPGSATVPFFGIETAILDPTTGEELQGNNVEGVLVLKTPWPSIARTIYQDHKRYLDTYMRPYPGVFYTGDGAARDEHGYIWIKGRVDGACSLCSLTAHRDTEQ